MWNNSLHEGETSEESEQWWLDIFCFSPGPLAAFSPLSPLEKCWFSYWGSVEGGGKVSVTIVPFVFGFLVFVAEGTKQQFGAREGFRLRVKPRCPHSPIPDSISFTSPHILQWHQSASLDCMCHFAVPSAKTHSSYFSGLWNKSSWHVIWAGIIFPGCLLAVLVVHLDYLNICLPLLQ